MSADDFDAIMRREARRAVFGGIKRRARRYRHDRLGMLGIHRELPFCTGAKAVAIADACVRAEYAKPRRFIGFGGEGPLMNAKAALLLARFERRFGARIDNAGEAA